MSGVFKNDQHPAYSPFNATGLPIDKGYQEFIEYAGTSGLVSQYDEETHTIKLIFTKTPSFHKVGTDARSLDDVGCGQVGLIFQSPEQLRIIAKKISNFAAMMEIMQSDDPDDATLPEAKDLLMGRKL